MSAQVQRSGTAAYRPSPIKRSRRSKAEIEAIKAAIYDTLAADHPQTLRGLFYRLVSQGMVPKTDAAYKTTVGRLCVQMRKGGRLPYAWLADNTRWMRKPTSFAGICALADFTARTYRRNLWNEQNVYVEVWCEKDALAGLLYEVTQPWDVPLMVTRGYSSLTYLFEAAQVLAAVGRPAFLYYLGDHDPSGIHIPRKVEEQLRKMAPGATLTFTKLAVTPDQIRAFNLPTRPTKRSDSRSRTFIGESVEVDALPAYALKQLVTEAITAHVDAVALAQTRVAEQSERDYLEQWASVLGAR